MKGHVRHGATVTCVAVFALLTGCAPKYAGPWNLPELYRVPEISDRQAIPANGPHSLESLYYAGEPYQGHATRVFAYVAFPQNVERAPAIVLVHGGGGKAFRQWAEMWADRGYVAIAMDLAGRGPDDQRLSDGGPDQGDDVKFNDIAKGVREAWPYHAVANVIRAHSLLRSMPGVDASRTAITGISWGGYLTCIVAGLDDRFDAAIPVYGCGYLHEDSVWVPRMNQLPPADRQAWIDNYDPSRYLPGARMPILFMNSTNDFAYPLGSYQKSYRSVQGPRTLSVTTTLLHSHEHGWAPVEIQLFIDSALRSGKPLARWGQVTKDGNKITAEYRSAVPVKSAALCYTNDFGTWQKRNWQIVPARFDSNHVAVDLPVMDGITWFLTLTDERGATVSTEHQTLAKRRTTTCSSPE